jgi:antitoxin component YwqK of YwqJK toxin-antitoxin module
MNKSHLLLLLFLILGCNEKKVEQNEMGEVVYYVNSDGLIDGLLTQYHHNGKIYWEVDFVDGLKQGQVEYFDSLGNLTLRANYIDSKLEGTNTE